MDFMNRTERIFCGAKRRVGSVRHRITHGASLVAGVAGLLIVFVPSGYAIDPLPEHIENASEAVRNDYIDRIGREGMIKKKAAGRERFEKRLDSRRHLIDSMKADRRQRLVALGLAPRSPTAARPVQSQSYEENSAFSNGIPNDWGVKLATFLGMLALAIGLHRLRSGHWTSD